MDCRRCRSFTPWLALLAAGMATSFPAYAAEVTEPQIWLRDYDAAVAQARTQSKLLLVVDLNEDVAADAAAAHAPLAQLYQSLTTADERVAALVAAQFVAVMRHVGPAECLQCLPPSDRARPPIKRRPGASAASDRQPTGEFAIAYVCLPNERVLHCIPGFVTADELLRELEWATATNQSRLSAPPAEKEWFVRQRHLAAISAANREQIDKLVKSKWREGFQTPKAQSSDDLLAVLRAAQDARERALFDRLQPNWRPEGDRQTLLAMLAAHGGLEATVAHPVLAEFPLPALAELSKPLYETTSGQRFWLATPDRQPLRRWWADVRRDGALSLLVVRDDPFYAAGVDRFEELRWPPANAEIEADLRHFATRQVTLDELALLVADAELDPVRFRASDGPPRYLVHDARGFRVAELSMRTGDTTRLAQALHAVTNPGDAAAAGGARGGTADERK